MVVPAEQGGEQLADRHEAAADVHAEEREDDQRGDGGNDVLLVVEAPGEEVGDGDGVAGDHGVAAQSTGHELPIEVGAEGKADGGPHRVGGTGEIGDTGQAHKQPAAHIGRFGAQRGQPRADASATCEILSGGRIRPFGVDESNGQHGRKVNDHGHQHPDVFGNHVLFLSSKTTIRLNVIIRHRINPERLTLRSETWTIARYRTPPSLQMDLQMS